MKRIMSKLKISIFSNLELNLRDWIVILLSLSIFTVSLVLFVFIDLQNNDSNREIVGTVVYRNRVAQRRNSSSSIWSDVVQKEQVRNFDSIRTDELAEAIINLNSGTRIELDPFSMIVLNIINDEVEIQLLRGSLVVDPNNKDNIKIRKGEETSIYFKQLIRIFGNESDLIQIFSNGKIEIQTLKEKNLYSERHLIELDKAEIQDLGETLETISPTDNSRYFVGSKESLNIQFLWKNEESENQEFILSSDPFFREILFKQTTNKPFLKLLLSDGNYYWKVKASNTASLTKRFKIKSLEEIKSISPLENEEISLDSSEFVPFSWNESELASDYKLIISKDPQNKETFLEKTSLRNSLSLSLPSGDYSWKVIGNGSLPGSSTSSEWKRFKVVILEPEQEKVVEIQTSEVKENVKIVQSPKSQEELSKPKPIYPLSVVDMANKDRLVFRWNKVSSAQKYEFILREGNSEGKELIRKFLNTNQFILNDLTLLDIGNFSWEVRAVASDQESLSSGNIQFRIILSSELEAPVIE